MKEELAKVNEGVAFLKRETEFRPHIGVVLGTGLGGLAEVSLIRRLRTKGNNFSCSSDGGYGSKDLVNLQCCWWP
jgi:purine nucleoside phosphorylase